MMVIMVEGALASFLGPIVGIAQPLDAIPQSVIWFFLAVGVLLIGATKRADPITWILEGVTTNQVAGVLVSGILVVVSLLGVARLNHTGNIHLAVIGTILDVVVLLAGVVGGWKRNSRWPLSTLLYSSSLALLLSTSLRGGTCSVGISSKSSASLGTPFTRGSGTSRPVTTPMRRCSR